MPEFKVPSEEDWSTARWVIEQYLTYLEEHEPGATHPIAACHQLVDEMGGPVEESFGG